MRLDPELRGWLIAAAVVLVLLLFVLPAMGVWHLSFWAPKLESARRQVFVQTPSYVQGKQQFLSRLHADWVVADPAHKQALCDLARHEVATLDREYVPNNLKNWECIQ